MNIRKFLVSFTTMFAITFVVSAIVSFLWNLIVHGTSTVEWETSFRLAIILGIVLSWMIAREDKKKEN
jgi:hypothetical protein